MLHLWKSTHVSLHRVDQIQFVKKLTEARHVLACPNIRANHPTVNRNV